MRLFILFVVLLNSVLGEESDVNARGRYSFNHPPLFEENPIPVAVVFEEGRSNDSPNEVTTTEHLEETVSEITTKAEYDMSVTTNTPLKVDLVSTSTEKEVRTRPRVSEIQIPVQVIYDTEPVLNAPESKPASAVNSKPVRRRLKQRRLLQNPGSTTTTTEKEIIVKKEKEITVETATEKSNIVPYEERKRIFERISGKPSKPPRERDPVVPILENENHVFAHSGNFRYSYEGGDGTRAFSEGELKTIDNKEGEAVVGGFSYTDNDGNDFSLSYTADENGYRPVGAHLPTPPPIPPAIARALAYLATATTPEPVTKSIKSIN